ncbi:hypothetical protein CFP56_031049 [Quercus suber]|uniref:Uncharacterized protein n=1 Tax=Quercus suber TaxID=58331 RepID=A0AAW0LWA0_QUESU
MSEAMVTHESSALPPQPPPKESFARRYKFLWPMLMAVNLAIGAYLFVETKKKDEHIEEEEKRKIKPKDPEEKKHIDEKKAILKQFIRAKPIPNIQLFNTCFQFILMSNLFKVL